LLRTEGRGDASRFARDALESGGRFVVAVGGDGTVHEVVNGMFDDEGKPLVPDAVLGVVAAGSGCDFVRTFGLPGDSTRACYHLAGDNTYPLDAGRSLHGGGRRATRYFVNVAEAGLGAVAAARADRMSPRLGQSKHFGFCLMTVSPNRVQADRKTTRARVPGGSGNARLRWRPKISPRSYPGDAVLDVLCSRGRSPTRSR
jgi:diacylglycerol kinase family enzyme